MYQTFLNIFIIFYQYRDNTDNRDNLVMIIVTLSFHTISSLASIHAASCFILFFQNTFVALAFISRKKQHLLKLCLEILFEFYCLKTRGPNLHNPQNSELTYSPIVLTQWLTQTICYMATLQTLKSTICYVYEGGFANYGALYLEKMTPQQLIHSSYCFCVKILQVIDTINTFYFGELIKKKIFKILFIILNVCFQQF